MLSGTHLQYLIVLGICIVVTLPLEFVFQARVYRQLRRMGLSVLPVALAFSAFDILSINDRWWHYSSTFTTGLLLPGSLPIEELAFFIVIPICALLTYEAVGVTLSKLRNKRR